jgi:predicted DsbA family dithiol-disulfide isomerase
VRIEKLRENYDVEIQWKAFPLHPEIPAEGITLERLFAGRNIDIPRAMARLKKVAEELGLPLGERKKSFNSRLAQELGKWAESKGKGDEFHSAVFRAYYVDGKNIGQRDVLLGLAKEVGLPEKEAGEILEARTFQGAVDADWKRSMELGISAVPTFVIDHQFVVGAQPYEILEKFFKDNGVKKRSAKA